MGAGYRAVSNVGLLLLYKNTNNDDRKMVKFVPNIEEKLQKYQKSI